jgi:hypothetical protein
MKRIFLILIILLSFSQILEAQNNVTLAHWIGGRVIGAVKEANLHVANADSVGLIPADSVVTISIALTMIDTGTSDSSRASFQADTLLFNLPVSQITGLLDSLAKYLSRSEFADSTQDNSHIFSVVQAFLSGLRIGSNIPYVSELTIDSTSVYYIGGHVDGAGRWTIMADGADIMITSESGRDLILGRTEVAKIRIGNILTSFLDNVNFTKNVTSTLGIYANGDSLMRGIDVSDTSRAIKEVIRDTIILVIDDSSLVNTNELLTAINDSLNALIARVNTWLSRQTFAAGVFIETDSLRISTPNVAGMHKTAIQISSADFGNAAGNEIGIQWMNNNFTLPVLSEASSWSDRAGRWGLRYYTYNGSQNLAVQINGDGNITKFYNDTTYGDIVGLNNLEMAGNGLFGKSVFIDGDTLYIIDASGQDTVRIFDDGDTTRIESDNPIKVGEGSIIVAGDTVVIDKNLKIQEGGSIRGITSEVNGLICNTMDNNQDEITITTIDSSGIGLVRVHWNEFTASINGVIFFIGNDSISVNTGDVLNATDYYVYLNSIGRVVSTTVNPNGSPHVRIADIRIRSSAGVAEVLGWRPGTPHTTEAIYEIYDWITSQPPVFIDGLETRFVSTTGRIDIELGTAFKAMHKVDLVDTGLDSVMIRTSNDTLVNDLAKITKYYDGTTIGTNKYFSVLIGRVVQDTSMVAKIAIAVQDRPSIEYVSATQAIDDVDMVKIAVFPGIYKGSVIPVAYAILKKGDPSTIQIIDKRH